MLLLCALLWADEFQSNALLHYNRLAPFSLSQDKENEQEQWFSARISVQYQHSISKALKVDFGLELTNHLLAGDVSLLSTQYLQPIDRSEFQLWPEKIRLLYQRPTFRFSFGSQHFQWGLGLFYSDKSLPAWFGYNTWNDSYLGMSIAYSPLPLSSKKLQITLFSAPNWILRNEYLSLYNGDGGVVFFNGILLSLPFAKGGLLFAPTWMEEETTYPIDIYLQIKILEKLFFEGEYLYRWSFLSEEWYNAHGGALRLKVDNPPLGYALELGQIISTNHFRKHRNNPVGSLLFGQYLPRKKLVESPDYPVQSSISEGQYTHAMIQFKGPKHGIRIGYLYARDTEQLPLGHEADLSLLWVLSSTLRLTIEGALLLPLEAWYSGARLDFQYEIEQKKIPQKEEKSPW